MHVTKALASFQKLAESVVIQTDTLIPVQGRKNLWRVDHRAHPDILETPTVKVFLDEFVATVVRGNMRHRRKGSDAH